MQKFLLLFLLAGFTIRGGTLLDESFTSPLGALPPNWGAAIATGSGLIFQNVSGSAVGIAQSDSEIQLYSPLLNISGLSLTVTLLHQHNGGGILNSGTVLEYSLNGNAYQDVLSTESHFLSGAYDHEVQSPNPLLRGSSVFRKVWTGGLHTSEILITPTSQGTIQFRFAAGDSLRAELLHFTVIEDSSTESVPEPSSVACFALAALLAAAARNQLRK